MYENQTLQAFFFQTENNPIPDLKDRIIKIKQWKKCELFNNSTQFLKKKTHTPFSIKTCNGLLLYGLRDVDIIIS